MSLLSDQRRQLLLRLCGVFCLVLTAVLVWRWERIFFLMATDSIISDIPNHVKLALSHNDYGLSSYIIRALYALGDEHFAQTALALVLTANQLLGIVTLWLLLRAVTPELGGAPAFLAVLLAHLCAPWLIPGVQNGLYLGVYNGNIYHNMTMLFSRSFIPLDLLFFFRCWDMRNAKLNLRDWLGFALCFLIATLFKPNFAFAFIPMLAVLLLIHLISTRGASFRNDFYIGLGVVPAGLACIWQYLVLFSGDFAGTSSSVALRILSGGEAAALALMYFRSLLLPIFTLCVQARHEGTQREHIRLIAVCTAVAVFEACILTETGFRANDGNFDWGSLSLYTTVFALSVSSLFSLPQRLDLRKRSDRILLAVGFVLLLGHLVTGVYCLSRPGHAGYDWFYF